MASFAQSLRTFRSGYLSFDDLLEEVDRILADGRAEATWLLATLSEEDAKSPLPADVCSALRDKLESLAQKEIALVNAVEGEAKAVSHDVEGTQLVTAYRPDLPQGPDIDESTREAITLNDDDIDPIKGAGDVLNNRFELQECVGSGGMSAVYKALDRRKVEADDRNPYVAVKVLNLEFRAHPDSLIALQREAKKCQSLAHPNIVRVYDFDRDGSTVYMTMEYLSGVSLGRKVSEPGFTGMTRDEALKIISDMGEALRFAHDSGIVHADFKPANVFITDDGKIKVIDFGIARAFQRDDAVEMEVTRFDPRSLGALTPTYASPEMLEHQEPDPRDDIYALACTAYEMLTGRHPFGRVPATVARETGLQLQRDKVLTRSQFTALRRALEFARGKRTATVGQFLKEIHQTAGVIRTSVTALGIIGLVVILGVLAGYYYLSGSGEGVFSDSVTRDRQSTGNPTIETDTLVSPATSADITAPNGQEGVSERESPAKTDDTDSLALVEQPSVAKSITVAEVAPLISSIVCAALKARIKDDNLYVKGFALQRDKRMLGNALSVLAGSGRVDLSGIDAVGEHQCSILERISGYWRINQSMKNRTSIASNKPDNRYLEGEKLVLNIGTPSYDSFVYVDYYSLDGGVLHMVPSPGFRANQTPAGYRATIGDLGEWAIAKPFGTELIVVLATSEPLFESLREEYEPQTEYLPELEKRLAQLTTKDKVGRVTADFILIRTKAR